jgi:hypothetical protein
MERKQRWLFFALNAFFVLILMRSRSSSARRKKTVTIIFELISCWPELRSIFCDKAFHSLASERWLTLATAPGKKP